ncbi:hypothetical protein S83_047472, partial [Arachis hypogaea]
AFKATGSGKYPGYRYWWTGLRAQLFRDVPYSGICWSTLEPSFFTDKKKNFLASWVMKQLQPLSLGQILLLVLLQEWSQLLPHVHLMWQKLDGKKRPRHDPAWVRRGRLALVFGRPRQAFGRIRLDRLALVSGHLGVGSCQDRPLAKSDRDHERALKMTTRTTLIEIWRDGGLRGLFIGVGPRVGRAGPLV